MIQSQLSGYMAVCWREVDLVMSKTTNRGGISGLFNLGAKRSDEALKLKMQTRALSHPFLPGQSEKVTQTELFVC